MKKTYLMTILMAWIVLSTKAEVFRTMAHSEQIKTLQVYPSTGWDKAPVIETAKDESIIIAFDEMSHDYHRIAYRILHCDADWNRSSMNELEYMEGFSENDVENYATSQETLVDYTHYELAIPNEKIRLKLAGNYAVQFFDRDAPDSGVLVTACFSIVRPIFRLEASVSTTTDMGYNRMYQQVEFILKTAYGQVQRPDTDLKVLVRQNHRTDNEVFCPQPLMASASEINYSHCRDLIFEAGNEYRRMEITTAQYAGIGVDKIVFQRPMYHAYLYDAEPRTSGYTYDEDQNGRFFIRSLRVFDDVRTEADYFCVHFRLPMNQVLAGTVYLMGDICGGRLDGLSKMNYSVEEKAYQKELLLKQGAYNYMYLWMPEKSSVSGKAKASTAAIEGNYWETENEYQIYVYYRPIGALYDTLAAFAEVTCKP